MPDPGTLDQPRVAIVTGGSRGLGRALTRELAARGWWVIADGRDPDRLHAAVGTLGLVEPVAGDVTDPAHRTALVDSARRHGSLDLLVNNASALGPSPLPSLGGYPLTALEAVYRTNVLAPLGLIQEALPLLRAAGGVVVNITSDAAVEGYPGWGGYGSSKAALEQISLVLAAEEEKVSVYWVDPGDMNTQMQQMAFPGEDVTDRPPPEDSVPGLMKLIETRPQSGRFHARSEVDR